MNNHIPIMPCCPPEAATVVTVQTVDGIKGLNNAFVRVIENNTVYFVDYKHRITPISSNIVEVNNYDVANNPSNFRGQIAFDTSNDDLIYFDYQGRGFGFGRSVSHADLEKIDAKVNLNAQTIVLEQAKLNGVVEDVAQLKEEVAAIDPTTIDEKLAAIQETVDDALEQVEQMGDTVSTLQKNTTNLEENLETVKADVASNATDIADNTNEITALQNRTVQTDTLVSGDESTVTVSKTTGNTTASETTALPLPVASSTTAGVLNAATYNAIQENSEDLNSILNGAVAIEGIVADPTQEALTEAWKVATGLKELINRASIYDSSNEKVWYYYTNINEWKAVNNTTEVTVSQFTNSTAGIIKGSENDGQVFAEADTTGSVVGWDALKARVTNLEENMPASVNLLTAYTATPTDNDTYSASYVNKRLDSTGVRLGSKSKEALNGPQGVAIGLGSYLADGSVVIGRWLNGYPSYQYLDQAVAIGVSAEAHGSNYGEPTVAVGGSAKATRDKAVALGYLAICSNAGAVSLGSGSITTRNYELSIGGYTGTTAGLPETRYLANVTAGELPTDAVNLQQMQDYVAENSGGTLYDAYSTATDGANTAAFINTTLNSTTLSLAKGQVTGLRAIAIGPASRASATGSTAIGDSAIAKHVGSTAIGRSSTTGREGEVSIGDSATNLYTYLANVRDGELDTDAVTVKQLKAVESATAPTTLYEGTASVNSITLSESANNFEKIEMVGELSDSGTKYQQNAVFHPANSARVITMELSTIQPTIPTRTTYQDSWVFSTDGTEVDLTLSNKLTELLVTGDYTASAQPQSTSNFAITKIIGYGKK